jgi:hypothetical protein
MSRRPATAPRWEAILSAVEQQQPGHWHMHHNTAVDEDPYGCIRLLDVELNGQRVRRYRVVTWSRDRAARQIVGYFMTLRRACEESRRRRQADATRPAGQAVGVNRQGTAYG